MSVINRFDKFLTKANLPENKVSKILIGERYTDIIEELKLYDIESVSLKKNDLLDDEISNHADILSLYFGNSVFFTDGSNFGLIRESFSSDVNIIEIPETVKSPYPNDVLLNCTVLGKYLICNENTVSRYVLDFAEKNGLIVLNTNQGYTKCSMMIVNDHAVITEDDGIERLLKKYQIDVLKISKGDVKLSEKHYGFIGGASCKISENDIYLTGNIKNHKDHENILSFVGNHNISLHYNESRDLTDIGGIIPVKEAVSSF